MESSDDSFAWSNASDDETGSDMAEESMSKTNYDEASESGNSYKKELRKRLFNECDGSDGHEDTPPRKKKKKRGNEEVIPSRDISSPKKKLVKSEPESDVDNSKKKNTTKSSNCINGFDEEYDESYLNMKVKEEQTFSTSTSTLHSKKKKKKNDLDIDSYHNDESTKFKKSKKKHNDLNDNVHSESAGDDTITSNQMKGQEEEESGNLVKYKKSKKKRNNSSLTLEKNSVIIKDMFSEEETVVESPLGRTQKHGSAMKLHNKNNRDVSDDNRKPSVSRQECIDSAKESIRDNSTSDERSITQNTNMKSRNHYIVDENLSDTKKSSKNDPLSEHKETCHEISMISNRIRFEGEDDTDVEIYTTQPCNGTMVNNDMQSLQFRNFLKVNPDLRSASLNLSQTSNITDEDEVWLLRCSREISIEALKGKTLKSEGKRKLRIDGVTYDSVLDEQIGRLAVISPKRDSFIIKNVPLNGTINILKRVSRAHCVDDDVPLDVRNNSVSLQETKVRHPFLESTYKRKILVQNREQKSETTVKKKNKKKKKIRESVSAAETRPAGDDGRLWDSETAIKDNLFNF